MDGLNTWFRSAKEIEDSYKIEYCPYEGKSKHLQGKTIPVSKLKDAKNHFWKTEILNDFQDFNNPDIEACERFRNWAEKEQYTQADFTHIFGVTRGPAGIYMKEPSKMSMWANAMLHLFMGDEAYYELVTGDHEYFQREWTKKLKKDLIEKISSSAKQLPLEELEVIGKLITSRAEILSSSEAH